MGNTSKFLENPLPHLQEVKKSASRIVDLEKQLLGHHAEFAALQQLKKLSLALGGAFFAAMALLFGLGWISIAMNEAGWSAGEIAVISFVSFSLIAAILPASFAFSRTQRGTLEMKFLHQRHLRAKRLQEELAMEKVKFTEASHRAVTAIRRDLVLENWVQTYPVETFTLAALAGLAAGYAFAKSQKLDITSHV